MRAFSPPAVVLVATALCTACGSERAVRVALEMNDVDGDSLCLVASAAGEVVFTSAYDVAALPPGERSLTFVAGERVHDSLVLTARVSRAGRTVAHDARELRFGDALVVEQTLRPRRCTTRPVRPLAARALGTFEGLPEAPRLLAVDHDGDGRDELLVVDAEGALRAMDAGGGVRLIRALEAAGASAAAVGDLDGDCMLDVVVAGPDGVRSVITGDAEPASVGAPARSIALGVRTDEGAIAIAIASEDGLAISAWDDDAPRTVVAGALGGVVAGDLTGDGRDELVVVGDSGVRVLVALASGFREESGALPALVARATGSVALGDLDGNGSVDLVSTSGPAVRVALNRGDGLLEDRTGASPPALESEARRIEVGDLDGNCAAEIVALDASGVVTVWSRDARGAWSAASGAPEGPFVDVVLVDTDGDGAREIALLDGDGGVTLWRP